MTKCRTVHNIGKNSVKFRNYLSFSTIQTKSDGDYKFANVNFVKKGVIFVKCFLCNTSTIIVCYEKLTTEICIATCKYNTINTDTKIYNSKSVSRDFKLIITKKSYQSLFSFTLNSKKKQIS